MTSPLLSILMQYAGSVAAGIVVGLLFKMYFAMQVQKKIRGYQGEIVKSHSRILRLEEINGNLEKRLNESSRSFPKDQLVMN